MYIGCYWESGERAAYFMLSATNQDRVRNCGGVEILVKKLEAQLNIGPSHVSDGLSPLLTTVDACITDNGRVDICLLDIS